MLEKLSVVELENFVRSHADFYDDGFPELLSSLSYELKECVLHKMIVNAVKLPADLRKSSAVWLISRGYSLEG